MRVLVSAEPITSIDARGATDVIVDGGRDDETTELRGRTRFHLVAPHRGWLVRALGPVAALAPGMRFEARALEKLIELKAFFGRPIEQVDGFRWLGRFANAIATDQAPPPLAAAPAVRSVDVVCCTYNRLDEPLRSLPTLLKEAALARTHGIQCTVRVVYQNDDFTQRLFAARPQWRSAPGLALLRSTPPGLPHARNTAIAASRADLIIFVDDDVELDEGFVIEHVRAADTQPFAVGVVGRIRSKHEGAERQNPDRAVGQFRPSGWVDGNFDSVGDGDAVIAPHTPRGANMAFRRVPLTHWFGTQWFDESLHGSAHREESTLALEILRRGGNFVYAPRASLYHFEAEIGGCENRQLFDPSKRLKHLALDQLFLNRFYAPLGNTAQRLLPLLTVAREVKHTEGGLTDKLLTARLGLKAYREGRRLWEQRKARDQQRALKG